mgnify:CR=1 FL=1
MRVLSGLWCSWVTPFLKSQRFVYLELYNASTGALVRAGVSSTGSWADLVVLLLEACLYASKFYENVWWRHRLQSKSYRCGDVIQMPCINVIQKTSMATRVVSKSEKNFKKISRQITCACKNCWVDCDSRLVLGEATLGRSHTLVRSKAASLLERGWEKNVT